jgi:hypothetical protein
VTESVGEDLKIMGVGNSGGQFWKRLRFTRTVMTEEEEEEGGGGGGET